MSMEIFWLLFLGTFSFLNATAANTVPILELKSGMVDTIVDYALILPDKGKTLSLNEALEHLASGDFKPNDSTKMPGKFVHGQYRFWISFTVRNSAEDMFYLVVAGPSLAKDSVYVLENGNMIDAFRTAFPIGKDTCKRVEMPLYSSFVYPIPPHRELSFMIALEDYSYSDYFLPVLADADHYEKWVTQSTFHKTTFYLLLIGMMASIIIFFGLQFLHSRDKADRWYMLYVLVMLVIAWRNLEGINPHYAFTYGLISWTHTKVFLTAATFITYTFFIRYFFGNSAPILGRVTKYVLIACSSIIALDLILLIVGNWYWSWLVYYWFRILGSLSLLVILFFIWKSPHPLAKYILSGSMCLIMGEAISWAVLKEYTSEVAYAGVFMEFIFFSYAMGLRFQLERQEKLKLAFANELLTVEKALETERLRTRIAQDIHDEVGASLTKISLITQVAKKLPDFNETIIREYLQKISANTRQAAGQLRDIVFGINPDYDSFSEMQAYFLECIHQFWEGQSLLYYVDFPSTEDDPSVSPNVKRQLLLILKEAMTNISRHANASEVHIRLILKNSDNYLLEIKDNGRGVALDTSHHFSNGLSGMRKRAQSIMAKLSIETVPGEGFHIIVEGKIGI